MKKGMLLLTFITLYIVTKAQCDKKIKWTASKFEMVDSAGNVESKEGEVTVTTGNGNIFVVAENGNEEMKGSITDYGCNWQDKNNGKMNFKSELTDKRGKIRHATVTIESKDGQTTITLAAKEEDKMIRLPVTAYEEVP